MDPFLFMAIQGLSTGLAAILSGYLKRIDSLPPKDKMDKAGRLSLPGKEHGQLSISSVEREAK